ncbi:MAG TPA: glycosyltransferase [Polyangiaceae bacterium]|nr:glycosyltransferase [Polyangiaceae bacterium]
MKILFVTPYLPSPPRFGGQRRLDGLMRNLAKAHEVSVISFNASDEFGGPALAATRQYCRDVVTLPDMEFRDKRRKRLLQARSLLSRHSFEHLLLARRRDFEARLRSLVASGRFDIVQIEFAQMAAFRLPPIGGLAYRSVLDEHNIEFDVVKRTAAAEASPTRRLYSAIDWRKLSREERLAWRRFDGVTVTSRRDANLLLQLEPGVRVAVIPNGVDTRQFSVSSNARDEASLLFFGAMNYFPNHDGVTYFVREIFPRILRRRPQTQLWLVGPAPPDIRSLQSSNVHVTDFVPEVEPYIDRASAVIVPLRLGGGTRLKIVEAMSKAKPIVSTRIGAEGIDVVHGVSALLADDPQAFADQVELVLADQGFASRLGAEARKLAEGSYGWPALVQRLESFYETLLRAPNQS